MSDHVHAVPELLEADPSDQLITLKLRVEAEMTAEPEIIKDVAPHLSSALIALLYHDPNQQGGQS